MTILWPAKIRLGFVSRLGFADRLAAFNAATDTRYRLAMEVSVSPGRTTYTTGLGVGTGRAVGTGLAGSVAVGLGVAGSDGDGLGVAGLGVTGSDGDASALGTAAGVDAPAPAAALPGAALAGAAGREPRPRRPAAAAPTRSNATSAISPTRRAGGKPGAAIVGNLRLVPATRRTGPDDGLAGAPPGGRADGGGTTGG
jgi:hypothetical protein